MFSWSFFNLNGVEVYSTINFFVAYSCIIYELIQIFNLLNGFRYNKANLKVIMIYIHNLILYINSISLNNHNVIRNPVCEVCSLLNDSVFQPYYSVRVFSMPLFVRNHYNRLPFFLVEFLEKVKDFL